MALSISASPLSSTSVGTRRSGLYGAILSASPKVDHGLCSKARPYSRNAIATRRTKGESYWPIRNMVLRSSLAFGRGRADQFPRQGRSGASKIMEVEHCAGCNGAATASAGCAIKDGIMTATMDINRERIAAIEAVIRPHIRRTPLVEADLADFGLLASPVIFKLEMLQHSGSFKARGAFANLLLRQLPEAGVVAASGGNHGAAVAYAAQRLRGPPTD